MSFSRLGPLVHHVEPVAKRFKPLLTGTIESVGRDSVAKRALHSGRGYDRGLASSMDFTRRFLSTGEDDMGATSSKFGQI